MRYPEIAKRFQLILDLRKMKARDLADKSGLTEAAISHFVHGNRCPNNKTAYILGKILNCSPAWLMDLDDKMENISEHHFKEVFSDFYKLPKKNQDAIIPIIKAIIEAEKNRGETNE